MENTSYPQVLKSLRIYGFSPEEEAMIISTILTGDPVLFIGAPGSAKTSFALRLAQAMKTQGSAFSSSEFSYVHYDCPSVPYEDMLGVPSIQALNEGRYDLIHTPTSVWSKDFVVLDEISRASPFRQSNFLEIIMHRTVQGTPTDVKYIVATMNPVGSVGTNPMVEALVQRFFLFISAKAFMDLSPQDGESLLVKSVASFVRNSLVDSKIVPNYDEAGEALVGLHRRLKKRFPDYLVDNSKSLATRIYSLAKLFSDSMVSKDSEIIIPGRRASMLVKNLALAEFLHLEYPSLSLDELRRVAIRRGLPIDVLLSSQKDTLTTLVDEFLKQTSPLQEKRGVSSTIRALRILMSLSLKGEKIELPRESKIIMDSLDETGVKILQYLTDSQIQTAFKATSQIVPTGLEAPKDSNLARIVSDILEKCGQSDELSPSNKRDIARSVLDTLGKVNSFIAIEVAAVLLDSVRKETLSPLEIISNLHSIAQLASTIDEKVELSKTSTT